MNYQEIVYEKHGQVAWIYLNRPEAMNSITKRLSLELDDALSKARNEEDVRVLVVSGKGRAFCAGVDLKAFMASLEEERDTFPDLLDCTVTALNHLRHFPKPVIAAVNGVALAGGLEMVMCCDLVIAAEGAKLGDAHANYGLVPGAGSAAVLPKEIGSNRAKYLLFTGDFFSAYEMKEWGLVNQVVSGDKLEETVQATADRMTEKSPLVLQRMKEVVNRSLDQSQEAALHHEMVMLRQHMRSNDIKEGLAAFKEKRKPDFKGT